MIPLLALAACEHRWDVVGSAPPADPQPGPTVVVVEPDPTTPSDVGCVTRSIGPDGGQIDAGDAALLVAPRTFGSKVEVVELCRTDPPSEPPPLSDGWEIRVAPDVAFQAPMELSLHTAEIGPSMAVFVPGPDGEQVRSLTAEVTGPEWWTTLVYRSGVATVVVDERVLEPYVGRETTADLLLLVDNSCSMLDEQEKLGNRLPAHLLDVLEAGAVDYRLAVVSTDNDDPTQMGNLIDVAGARWVEASTPDRDAVLEDLVHVGNQGSLYEQGLATVGTALSQDDGFLRDDSSLVVVAVTHRDDYSQISAGEFADQMLGMSYSRPSVAFHSLVATAGLDRGTKYIDVSAVVGGYVGDLVATDWNRYFEEIALDLTRLGGMELRTDEVPELWLVFADGSEPVQVAEDEVVFEDSVLYGVTTVPEGASVWVLYKG